MYVKNFNQALTELQPYLIEYLEEKGIDTKQKFCCLNPKHTDSNPSCSVIPGGTRAFCFGCGQRFDLFDAFCILENKPRAGRGFVTEVVQVLAKKFKIKLESAELTPEQLLELKVFSLYRSVAEYMMLQPLTTLAEKEIKRRKWSQETLTTTMTGCIPDFDKLKEHLISLSYESDFIDECDINRKDIFNNHNLIFTTCDEYGHPVGFTARNLKWSKDGQTEKYINQRTTGVKVNIFQKGKRLFGYHLSRDAQGPHYVFEGQGDFLTAWEAGLRNCSAIGGTSLTTDHILLLKEYNKFNIVLSLDGDLAGQNKVEKLLDDKFALHKDVQVSIILIPEGMDPDDFIRTEGLIAFQSLIKKSAFEWRLDRFPKDAEPLAISQSMIPIIATAPSYLAQEDMCKILSLRTGYSIKTLQMEVERLLNVEAENKLRERKGILERGWREALENPHDAEIVLTSVRNQLIETSKKYNEDRMSEMAFLTEIMDQKKVQESKDGRYSGFVLGSDLQHFEEVMQGQWDKDVFMVIGGSPNSGKTSYLCKLAYSIASHEKENDPIVIYHTIDDTTEQLLPKLVAIAEGSKTLTLNQIKDPNYWAKTKPDLLQKRTSGYSSIQNLAKNGRLIIKDANHGLTLSYVETLISYYKAQYPNRKMFYILDNFHKLQDFVEHTDNERVRFKHLSSAIKGLATSYHIPIFASVEYTKLAAGTRPSNNNISETRAIEYDSNFIAHLYNDLHEKGPNAELYHMAAVDGLVTRLPRIEMIIGKNKISSFKSSLYFDFYPSSSDFISIDTDTVAADLAAAKEEHGSDEDEDRKYERSQHKQTSGYSKRYM